MQNTPRIVDCNVIVMVSSLVDGDGSVLQGVLVFRCIVPRLTFPSQNG